MAATVINEVLANGSVYANGFYGTGIANGYSFRAQSYTHEMGGASSASYVDQFTIQLTGYAPAPATLYFYNYNSSDRMEIYQNGVLIASTSDAINLTPIDRVFVLSNNAGQFFDDSPDLYLKDFIADGVGGVSYAGKVTWTHNPASGTKYIIKTIKSGTSYDWRYIVEYPIDGFTVGCPPTPPVYTAPPPPPPAPVIVTPSGDGGGCGCGKIVCTAMNEQYGFGTFRQTIWLYNAEQLPKEYEKGYHKMFLPLVRYLYKTDQPSKIQLFLKGLLEDVVKHRTADIWQQRKGKRDKLGSWYRAVFDPLCYYVGLLVNKSK
jgi:hypothetical protein